MTETMQAAVDVFTAASALGAFLLSGWNAYKFATLTGRVDAIERTQNAHVNAAGLHRSA